MKSITTRQLIIFYVIWSASIKFLALPSLLARDAGRDAWLAAAIATVLELLILFLVLNFIIYKNKFNLKFIKYFKYLFYLIAFGILGYELYVLTTQTFHLLNDNLFERVSWAWFVVPMALLGVFFCFMPTKAVFRSGEVFFLFVIAGVVLAVGPALPRIDVREVLPIGTSGTGMLLAVAKNLIYFESGLFILIFARDIQISPHFRKKFMTVAALTGAFFVFFLFMVYSLLGPLTTTNAVALTSLMQSARLDWVVITMWLLLVLLRFGVTFFCAFKCLTGLCPFKLDLEKVRSRFKWVNKLWNKKAAIVFLALLVCLLPMALTRPAQMTTKAILTDITIDRVDGEYVLTGEKVTTEAGDKGPKFKTEPVTGTDAKFVNTINKIADSTGKTVSFAHCSSITLKDGLADEDVTDILKFFMYQTELNNNCKLSWAEASGRKTTLEQFFRDYLRPEKTGLLGSGPARMAVFRDGVFDFELDEAQTNMWAYITGEKPNARVEWGDEFLILQKNSAKMRGNNLTVRANFKLETDPFATRADTEGIRMGLERQLRDGILETLRAVYPTDVYNVRVDIVVRQ